MGVKFPPMVKKTGKRYYDGSSKSGRQIMAANSIQGGSVVLKSEAELQRDKEVAEWNAKIQAKKEQK